MIAHDVISNTNKKAKYKIIMQFAIPVLKKSVGEKRRLEENKLNFSTGNF